LKLHPLTNRNNRVIQKSNSTAMKATLLSRVREKE